MGGTDETTTRITDQEVLLVSVIISLCSVTSRPSVSAPFEGSNSKVPPTGTSPRTYVHGTSPSRVRRKPARRADSVVPSQDTVAGTVPSGLKSTRVKMSRCPWSVRRTRDAINAACSAVSQSVAPLARTSISTSNIWQRSARFGVRKRDLKV